MLACKREVARAVAQENMAGCSADPQRRNERGSRHDMAMTKLSNLCGGSSNHVSPGVI